jgi:cell division protein FtsL
MTKKFLDITLSLFLIICAIVLIFLVINEKKLLNFYSASLEAQKNTAIELQNTLNNIL